MLDLLLIVLEDPTPKPTDVKAGPLGFAVWIFMILAVVVIGFSLARHLRKAEANRAAGVFGDVPRDKADDGAVAQDETDQQRQADEQA